MLNYFIGTHITLFLSDKFLKYSEDSSDENIPCTLIVYAIYTIVDSTPCPMQFDIIDICAFLVCLYVCVCVVQTD